MEQLGPIKELSICGGGVRGFGFLGALYHLWERGILKPECLKSIACVSIGSWLGAGLCIGLTPKDIGDYFFNIDIAKVKDIELLTFFERKSILKGDKIREFITNFISLKEDPSITLSKLYNKNKIRLIITTVCLNDCKVYYIDHISHPDLELRDAILMSSSIPGLFPPIEYKGKLYVDSGIIVNNPINILSDDAWGISDNSECNESEDIKNMFDYIISIIRAIYKNIDKSGKKTKQRIINVTSDKVSVTSFGLTKDIKFELFYNGIGMTKYQINHMILQESLLRKFY